MNEGNMKAMESFKPIQHPVGRRSSDLNALSDHDHWSAVAWPYGIHPRNEWANVIVPILLRGRTVQIKYL